MNNNLNKNNDFFINENAISEEVKDTLNVIEQIYGVMLMNLQNRVNNFKRINIDSLIEFAKYEYVNGRIKNRKDIIKYIESITQD